MKISSEFKEHKKMSIKKIIAREGLIILGFILLALIIKNTTYKIIYDLIPDGYSLEQKLNIADRRLNIAIYLPYCLCLLIRFILWAVRTLKQKEEK